MHRAPRKGAPTEPGTEPVRGGTPLDQLRKTILKAARDLRAEAEAAASRIADLAELPLMERGSAALLKEALGRHGFRVGEQDFGVPNAFVAEAGKGGPVIGLLAEYDALPDCGPDGRAPGHGCGHNLLGAGSVFAALAAARGLLRHGLPGTIRLYGCPAEETLVGKVYMAREGAFDSLDACLAWHPSSSTEASNGSGTAMDSVTYEFYGKTAHAAGDPHNGRSALDAVEIMNVAVNFLREHVPSNVRIHYAIMDGGKAPNVVPSYARSWYFVRGKDREEVNAIRERVHKCARAAALATETTMKRTILTGVYDRLGNDALAKALDANLRRVGAPKFDAGDAEFARSLGLSGEFAQRIGDISTSRGAGSSDEANVSWVAPMSVLGVACWGKGTPGHNTLVHKQAAAPAAMKGLLVAVKTLALTAADLAVDADLVSTVREEFSGKVKGNRYDPIVPRHQRPPVQDRIPR